MRRLLRTVRDDRAQDLTEFALLAGLIAVAALGAVFVLQTQILEVWHDLIVHCPFCQ